MAVPTRSNRVDVPRSLFRRAGVVGAVAAVLTALAVQVPAQAAGSVLYVTSSTAANPTCAAASKTHPFHTIAGALGCAVNGTVVNIGAGTFAGGVTLPANVTLSGTGRTTVIAGSPVANGTVITVPDGRRATLQKLTVDGQTAHPDVATGAANTTLLSVTLTNGVGQPSGGISVNPTAGSATLVVRNSTFNGNLALQGGGAIAALKSPTGTTTVSVDDSTISGNTSNGSGGGIYVDGASLAVLDSTIADNSASSGGGIAILNDSSGVSLGSTLLAHNTATSGPDCSAGAPLTIVDLGYNLLGQNTGTASSGCPGIVDGVAGSQVGTPTAPIDPLLASLAANGGPTNTRALMIGSPALGTGGESNCTVAPISNKDQRGTTRTTATRPTCDVGAYDTGGTSLETLYVRSSAASDPACGAASQAHPFLTLAAALACAHNGTTVNIGAGSFAGVVTVPVNAILLGAGRSTIITGGSGFSPEITIPGGRTVTMRNLEVDGQAARGDVAADGVSATLLSVTLTGGAGTPAGGISVTPSSGDATVDIRSSTLYGNLALQGGGGIGAVAAPSGKLSVALTNSTVTGNSSNGTGGGVYLDKASLTARNSTIAGNTAQTTGGGLQITSATGATVTLTNTLLAANTATGGSGVDCDSAANSVVDGGHNLIGQNTGVVGTGCPGLTNGVNGTRVGTTATPLNPHLGALAANGGPTQTLKLLTGSPAIGTAALAACKAAPVSNLDQRGVKRSTATRKKCDIGAYDTAGKA